MKSDDAREMSDVAHQVKNKQLFLNKRLEQEQKLEDKGQDAEANQPVTEDRKKQIQDIIKNS
tara:strand:+ start:204 stop:389 length:186 start_codon:yes stop_codon:yes gene_type:complete